MLGLHRSVFNSRRSTTQLRRSGFWSYPAELQQKTPETPVEPLQWSHNGHRHAPVTPVSAGAWQLGGNRSNPDLPWSQPGVYLECTWSTLECIWSTLEHTRSTLECTRSTLEPTWSDTELKISGGLRRSSTGVCRNWLFSGGTPGKISGYSAGVPPELHRTPPDSRWITGGV